MDELETVKSQLEAAYAKVEIQYNAMPCGKDEQAVYEVLVALEELIGALNARLRARQDEPSPEEFPERTYNRNGPRTFDWPDKHEREI